MRARHAGSFAVVSTALPRAGPLRVPGSTPRASLGRVEGRGAHASGRSEPGQACGSRARVAQGMDCATQLARMSCCRARTRAAWGPAAGALGRRLAAALRAAAAIDIMGGGQRARGHPAAMVLCLAPAGRIALGLAEALCGICFRCSWIWWGPRRAPGDWGAGCAAGRGARRVWGGGGGVGEARRQGQRGLRVAQAVGQGSRCGRHAAGQASCGAPARPRSRARANGHMHRPVAHGNGSSQAPAWRRPGAPVKGRPSKACASGEKSLGSGACAWGVIERGSPRRRWRLNHPSAGRFS